MYGERDQATVEALLQSGADFNTLAAVLLRVPTTSDPTVNKMIRLARVMDLAIDLSVSQLAVPSQQPKDISQMMSRNVIVAQQMQTALEKVIATTHRE
ncbi:MAG: hypothetical protein ABSF50_01930 [Burkholderiaceae bacterium]|jgi:hypothetical protein